ncbi:MAG: hypothetical protein R3E50_06875 [Halioglobus sp.]
MNGGAGRAAGRVADASGEFLGRLDGAAALVQVAAAHGAKEDVPVMPHHTLGHAGGAAGVDDVEIVRVPWCEVAQLGAVRQRFLVVVEAGVDDGAGRVRHTENVVQLRDAARDGGHRRGEGLVDHEGHQVRVIENVLQFPRHVVVVDIDRHRTQFVGRQHALEVFAAVVQLQPDVVALPDAEPPPAVGQPRGPFVQFPVAQPALHRDDGGAFRHRVGDGFEQVGEIEGQLGCHGVAVLLIFLRAGSAPCRGGHRGDNTRANVVRRPRECNRIPRFH